MPEFFCRIFAPELRHLRDYLNQQGRYVADLDESLIRRVVRNGIGNQRDLKAMCHVVKRVGGDEGGHWEIDLIE